MVVGKCLFGVSRDQVLSDIRRRLVLWVGAIISKSKTIYHEGVKKHFHGSMACILENRTTISTKF